MSEITTGYTKPNYRSVGGILKLIIYALENRASYTRVDNAITAISMDAGEKAFTFDVEMNTANAVETQTGSRENFTVYSEQAVTAVLTDKTNANITLLTQLASGRLGVIVVYESGLVRHFGLVNGLMVDTETDDSGTAYGDRNGHEVAMSGKETAKAPTMALNLAEALLIPTS